MTGNSTLDRIFYFINLLLILAAVSLFFYANNFIKKPMTDETQEFSNMIKGSIAENQKSLVKFDELVINLYSKERRLRFLNLIMDIETLETEQIPLVENARPMIIDELIDIASNMSPNELNSLTGRLLLETRLKNKINTKLGRPVVKKVFFSKFIIQ